MSTCQIREELTAYMDEELGSAERRAFEAHLGDCVSCREALRTQAALNEALGSLPTIEPEPGFESRFWARVTGEAETGGGWLARVGRGRLLWSAGLAAAAAAALLLVLRTPVVDSDPDYVIVADAEQFELLNEDIELLDIMEILEAWDGQEI